MNALRIAGFWAVAVVFPLPLVLVYDAIATEPVTLKQLVLFGLIAYCWWLLAILLSVRPRWLDRLVGLPAVYRLHGVLGLGALVLAYILTRTPTPATDWPRPSETGVSTGRSLPCVWPCSSSVAGSWIVRARC